MQRACCVCITSMDEYLGNPYQTRISDGQNSQLSGHNCYSYMSQSGVGGHASYRHRCVATIWCVASIPIEPLHGTSTRVRGTRVPVQYEYGTRVWHTSGILLYPKSWRLASMRPELFHGMAYVYSSTRVLGYSTRVGIVKNAKYKIHDGVQELLLQLLWLPAYRYQTSTRVLHVYSST